MSSVDGFPEMSELPSTLHPAAEGDLIGSKLSTARLVNAYASSDASYALKTRNLATGYPFYRPVRGDGNCGFRALAFGYLECLLEQQASVTAEASSHLSSPIGREMKRIENLDSTLDATGQERFLYEDFVQVTIDLLSLLASTAANDRQAVLWREFNSQEISDAITQHFRMLTSAQLKLNPSDYEAFIPDETITTYCQKHVDPFAQEIEHIGLKALIDCLVTPAGIPVDCLYLDRSAGDRVTLHSFPVPPTTAMKKADEGKRDSRQLATVQAPVIRLLYRPGHYDLLYKQTEK